ncbi:hypothetical protein GCM10023329_37170 [Streptomyces sanyensis]|uniref:Uncharacterized protein n=1 Tax=Streptomyces sanyensis TaxID=568869 RepID=A0ABP9AP56_9ACTN
MPTGTVRARAGTCQAPQTTGVPVLPAGGAQRETHMGLAGRVPGTAAVAVRLAQGRHRLPEGGERREGVPGAAAVLDDVLPPAFGVVVARGVRQGAQRVDPRGRPPVAPPVVPLRPRGPVRRRGLLVRRQQMGGRQVDEADRHTAGECPADRHPLGAEGGERPERRAAGVVRRVDQQGDRGPHPLGRCQRQQGVALGRPLDQHRGRLGGLQRGQHGAGGARPVVPDAEEQGAGHPSTSRQAR